MAKVPSDIEIAQAATKQPIAEIAGKLNIPADSIIPFGHDKAKITYDFLESINGNPDGKLILVTAISPTPAGEGKTTTTVGLGDGLNKIGKKAVMCLREPSLGPCFGMKGGAAGVIMTRTTANATMCIPRMGKAIRNTGSIELRKACISSS